MCAKHDQHQCTRDTNPNTNCKRKCKHIHMNFEMQWNATTRQHKIIGTSISETQLCTSISKFKAPDQNSENPASEVVIRTCSNYNLPAEFSDLWSNALNFEIDVHNFVSEIYLASTFQCQIATYCVIVVDHEHMFRVTPLVNRVSRCIWCTICCMIYAKLKLWADILTYRFSIIAACMCQRLSESDGPPSRREEARAAQKPRRQRRYRYSSRRYSGIADAYSSASTSSTSALSLASTELEKKSSKASLRSSRMHTTFLFHMA